MAPYVHGGNVFAVARANGWDWHEIVDFSASINPLGPSPAVLPAIKEALDRIERYPEPHAEGLVSALAHTWDVDPDSILTGNGATELIHFLAWAWPHEHVSISVPAFSEFHRAYPQAALVRSGERPPEGGLLIVTRPNSPVGIDVAVPDRDAPTLVDESFLEFSDLRSSIGEGPVVLRSLTKLHALPGLRIGAVVGPPPLIRSWRERRAPWQVNVLAQAAAIAALDDPSHTLRSRDYVAAERERLWPELCQLRGVMPVRGCANFYFARLAYRSADLCDFLLRRRMLLRDCTGWLGVDGEAVRFAIRSHEENDRLLASWKEYPCDC